jgi:uncharacterized protein (TIGR01777 family)
MLEFVKIKKRLSLRVAICGPSGFVGTKLSHFLVSNTHEVIRIGREHFKDISFLVDSLEGCDVIINLCGESFIKKWDEPYKHQLYVSRVDTTKKLVRAIGKCKEKPKKIIIASSVKVYKESLVHDEKSNDFCTDYLALLIKEHEQAAKEVEKFGVTCIKLRFGYILGIECGLIQEFTSRFKFGLGFVIGDGKQPLSWVHIDDVIGFIYACLKNEKSSGIYNVVSCETVTMKTFATTLGFHLKKHVYFKLPTKLLKFLYAEGAENLSKGAFVTSNRTDELGYKYKYENLTEAFDSIFQK